MALNSSVSSKSCDAFLQAESQMHNIDEDVEKMNFKLISVESSIRRLLAERQSTGTECHGSVFANQTKSRKNLEAAASKLLLSREKQQDRIIRLRLKKDWEQETKLINDVAIPALKLSDKSAALINASRKKLFEKKIQLVKLNSELKTMNLQSVIEEITNAEIKTKCIEQKKKAALQKVSVAKVQSLNHSQSPTKLAWAVQSPRIAPRMLQSAMQHGSTDDSPLAANTTFITAIPVGHSVPIAAASLASVQNPKESQVDPGKRAERSKRNYSILTDRDIPSRELDHETEIISDCVKGSRQFIMRKWQLLKILDELK